MGMNLKWFNDSFSPTSSSNIETILNTDEILLIDLLPINESVQFIEIVELTGILNWKLKGSSLYVNQKIYTQDLYYCVFKPNSEGGGLPYSEIKYTAGNELEDKKDDFTSTLNIDTIVDLNEFIPVETINYADDFDDNGSTVSYNVIEENVVLEIVNGLQNGIAQVEFVINSPFLALNDFNRVFINTGGVEIEKSSNETFVLDVDLDMFGKSLITINNYIVEDTAVAKTGLIDITLLSVDDNVDIISATDFEFSLVTNI